MLPSLASVSSSSLVSLGGYRRLPCATLFYSLHRRDTYIFSLHRHMNKITADPDDISSAEEQINSTVNNHSNYLKQAFLLPCLCCSLQSISHTELSVPMLTLAQLPDMHKLISKSASEMSCVCITSLYYNLHQLCCNFSVSCIFSSFCAWWISFVFNGIFVHSSTHFCSLF